MPARSLPAEKALAGASNHDQADFVGLFRDAVDVRPQFEEHRHGQGIEFVGPVQRQRRQPAAVGRSTSSDIVSFSSRSCEPRR
jgi:hypothetical protein